MTFSADRDEPSSKSAFPALVKEHAIDLVLANGENAAAGFGITPPLAEELFEMGIDVLTTGNHIWDKREIIDYFARLTGIRTVRRGASCVPRTTRLECRGGACTKVARATFPTP